MGVPFARVLTLVGLFGFVCCGVGCLPPSLDFDLREERVVVSDGWLAMGTFFDADMRVPPKRVDDARAWLDAQRGEIARLERVFSRHDPGSELSRLNAALAEPSVLRDGVWIGPELEGILYESL